MPKLKPPVDGGSISINGVEHKAGEDGLVEFNTLADETIARSHGYIDPPPKPVASQTVTKKADDEDPDADGDKPQQRKGKGK